MFSAIVLAAATLTVQHLPTVCVHAPNATLTLQVAKTEAQREFGLMNVTSLPAHTGMVFVFEQDAPVEFWMKDTLIPLDMVFVASDGRVRSVASNVPATTPDTADELIARRSGKARFVIELPAGEAARDGIVAGARLTDVVTNTREHPL